MQHKRSLHDDINKFEYLAPKLEKLPLNQITSDLIEQIAQEKEKAGAKNATVNRLLALIRCVLNKAQKHWEWIDRVPHIRMRVEDNKRIRWLTKDEATRLVNAAPDWLKPVIQFSLMTGLRQSNAWNLKWSQIDFDRQLLIIPAYEYKTNKTISIPLSNNCFELLCSLRPIMVNYNCEFVFTRHNQPIPKLTSKLWKRILTKAEITDFRWHDLRHSWASWFLQAGGSLHELQQLGGWTDLTMPLRYGHLCHNKLIDAANRIEGFYVNESCQNERDV